MQEQDIPNDDDDSVIEATELRDAAISGFQAGAMWAARELGLDEAEAMGPFFKRAARAAREGFEDDREDGDE
jgi:hypothetical protein